MPSTIRPEYIDCQSGNASARPAHTMASASETAWPRERYNHLWLTAEYLSVEGASHWGLVLQRRALSSMIPAVLRWITQHT